MRKLLLLISAMLIMTGIINAQDVYSAGFYTSNGVRNAAVYKNNERLYYASGTTSYKHSSSSVVVSSSNDVYWVDNSVDANSALNYNYGDVFKNGNRWLSNPTGSGSHINALFRSSNNNIFAVGCKNVNNVRTAVIWRNNETTPLYTLGNGTYESSAFCGVIADGYAYVGGYQQTSASYTSRKGVVWYQGTPYITLDEGTEIRGIAYYDGHLYYCGTANESGVTKLKVWKDGGNVLYTLVPSDAATESYIYVDANDVYVTASYNGSHKIWKNGVELYTMSSGHAYDVMANTDGVYYGGTQNSTGKIWKDGSVIYTPSDCDWISDIYVPEPTCASSEIRTLPYNETFENGDTEWACWTKVDTDESGGFSSWERSGKGADVQPYAGSYCVRHGFNGASSQEGWLISPRIFLQPGRDYTTLTFMTYEQYPGDMRYEGVWISTTSTSTSAFTEIWSQNSASDQWTDVSINLKPYQGQAVYIAFKYSGLNGHNWYIDNINITETWTAGSSAYVPYYESFPQSTYQEPGFNWYVLDNDHTGEGKNWKWNNSESCAYHPWGQQNMPQEGWMISRSIILPSGQNYMLSFRTKNNSSGPDMMSSLYIAVDETGVPDIANYTTKLWEENTTTDWHTVDIDLSNYAGHTVRLGFKYEGTYAHAWYVDDIAVEENIVQYNINVVANNPSWGEVTGGNTYDQGATATITATPNSGYDFLKWTKDGVEVSTDPSYSFTVTENATYTAVFGEQSVTYYTIIAEANPIEAGWVEGGDVYEAGATAILFASPNMGWIFDQWQDGNTDNPRTITVTGDATYTALFSQMTYSINVSASPAEGGTVEGTGTYPYGEYVVLRAHANEGYNFLNWNDGYTDNERVIVVDGDADYVAYFAEEGTTTYTITVLSNDSELGYVEGGGTFPEGTVITISATPIGYATFVEWNDGIQRASREVTVTADATYIANFAMGTLYTITVEAEDPTMGTASGGGEFPAGAEIMIQATPYGGYHFNGWTDDNYENPRIVTVTGNATYKARFSEEQQQTFHITVLCNVNEGTVVGTGDYPAGTNIQIAAIPNAGYKFKEWNDSNTQNPRTITVNADAIYFATFMPDAIDENGTQSISLYPNPANDIIYIEGLGETSEVRIYNVLGELLKVVNVSDGQEIHVNDLSAGLYIVRSGNAVLKFTKK